MVQMPDFLSALLRAASFVLLLQAAGIAIFLAFFGQLLEGTLAGLHRTGATVALVAMALVAGHQFLEAARMAGEMSGSFDPSLQALALRSSAGAAFAWRMVGATLVVVGLLKRARWLGVSGAVVAAAAFAMTGHTTVSEHRLLAASILAVHLLVVAFWIGALWPLYLATMRETPATAGRLIDAFSNVAAWVVPCVALLGVGLTVVLVPGLAVFSEPYGQLLLVKAGAFTVLMALAALNKWKIGPGIGRGDPGAARAFRRTVAIEYVLICAVLATTAVMTMFYSPEVA